MSVVSMRSCCTFRGLSLLAAALLLVAMKTSQAEAGAVDWDEMYVPYNKDGNSKSVEGGVFVKPPFTEKDLQRQHLHIYQQPSLHPLLDRPSPVFFFGHANGGNAKHFGDSGDLESIIAMGFSVISWESVTVATTPNAIQTCMDDFELVWSWFEANADHYSFDPDRVIIGGRSRGTICSWKIAHSGIPGIKGLYMVDALPNSIWIPQAKAGPGYVWDQMVNKNSPPMHMLFSQECPKPITQDCEPSPDPSDIHNPRNGQTIADRYNEIGIGSKIQLTDGLTNDDIDPYSFFSDFVAALSSTEAKPAALAEAKIEVEAEQEAIVEFEAELEAEEEAATSGSKFLFDLMVVSIVAFSAAFAYDRYYKSKQSYSNQAEYEHVKLNGEVSMQEMGIYFPRDEDDENSIDVTSASPYLDAK